MLKKFNAVGASKSAKLALAFLFIFCYLDITQRPWALTPQDNLNSIIGVSPLDSKGADFLPPEKSQNRTSNNKKNSQEEYVEENRYNRSQRTIFDKPVMEEKRTNPSSNNNNNVIVIERGPAVVEKPILVPPLAEPEPKKEEPNPELQSVTPPAPTIIQVLPALPLPPNAIVQEPVKEEAKKNTQEQPQRIEQEKAKPKDTAVDIPKKTTPKPVEDIVVIEDVVEVEIIEPESPPFVEEEILVEVTQEEDPLDDFFRAVREDNDILVREFLEENQLWIKRTNELGQFAIHVAAEAASLRVLTVLLAYKANVNAKDRLKKTALDTALLQDDSYEHARFAEAVIRAGSNAPQGENFAYLLPVLRVSGDLYQKFNFNGETALHIAAERDHTGFVLLFLKKGLSVRTLDSNGQTPLHTAVSGRAVQAVRILLEAGADVNTPDFAQSMPLHLAFATENPYQLITLLLSYGADANAPNIYGNTPLIMVAIFNLDSRIAVELMSYRAKVNTRNNYGDYALLYAVKNGNIDLAYFLLNNGADPYVRNNNGESAVSAAAIMGGNLMNAFNAYSNRW